MKLSSIQSTWWKKNYGLIVFFVIFSFGIGLRVINYSDFLVFKSDQARDALIVEQAVKGNIFSMSLLGPQVAGTGLRLGPVFYYFQYFSAKLFGASPESFAYPDLLWGILTLPVLFFLFRRFFSISLSLWLTALASVSLFLVTFSRFGWNPNGFAFFSALFAWSFISALEVKGRARLLLLGTTAACLGIVAQLHLMAILGLGLGLIAFLIFSKALGLREIVFCSMIVMSVNFPVFLNEWQTKGANAQSFVRAVNKKGPGSDAHAWPEKVFRAYQESAGATWLVATGQQNTDTILTRGFSLKCDKKCKSALPYSLSAMAVLGWALVSVYLTWRTAKDAARKRSVVFLAFWFGSFFLATILVAYQIEPRYYLGIAPLIFVFLGFAIERLLNVVKNVRIKRIILIAGIFLLFLNFHSTARYLRELSVSQVSAAESGRDLRFGTAPKVTLGQLRAIANEASRRLDLNNPVFISGESHYVKSLYYLISVEHGYRGCYVKGEAKNVPTGFNHLFILETDDDVDTETNLVPFGTLAATFTPTDFPAVASSIPNDCLTY